MWKVMIVLINMIMGVISHYTVHTYIEIIMLYTLKILQFYLSIIHKYEENYATSV